MEKLEKLLEHFFNKKCILCGDFNVNLLTDSKEREEFSSLLKCYNFRPLLDVGTFKCPRFGSISCLDNIITNIPEQVISKSEVDFNGLSDGHACISCSFQLENTFNKNSKEQIIFKDTRTYTKMARSIYRSIITKQDWGNLGVNQFLKVFNSIFKDCFRKRKKKLNIKKSNSLKWLSIGIKISSKMKRVLAFSSGCHKSILDYKINYIRVYKKVLRCAKKLAVQKEISDAKHSSKKIWEVVNKHINLNPKSKSNIKLKINNKIVSDPNQVANIFVECFDHGKKLSTGDSTLAKQYCKANTSEVKEDMNLWKTSPYEIAKIVSKMANRTSFGYDEIPTSIFKENIDILQVPLSEFINNCLAESTFPEQLKIARIIPIHKKKEKTIPSNYRPISLLPILSKILEYVIKSRLTEHLRNHEVLNHYQFGFKRGVSTGDAIDCLMARVTSKLNDRKRVAGVFIDLSAAFKLVDHGILLQKLEHYGIKDKAFKLMKSYLSNRKQLVEVISIVDSKEIKGTSKLIEITRGVPQGSILGPILFSIFANDLVEYMRATVPDVELILYADDTNAILHADNVKDLNIKINLTLQAFKRWFTVNNLKINNEKTNIMLFKTTARNTDKMIATLDSITIEQVNVVKFLGVNIDSLLNWKTELEEVESKISSACYALRSLRDELTEKQLITVYYALVESRLRYSIVLWGNSYKKNMKKAFVCQKRAIRTIVRIPQWISCKDHFIRLGVLTVPSLYIFLVLTKYKKNQLAYETSQEQDVRNSTRRRDLRYFIQPRLDIVKHSLSYNIVRLFNRLPTKLKHSSIAYNVFKNTLKRLLLKKCFYSIDEFMSERFDSPDDLVLLADIFIE